MTARGTSAEPRVGDRVRLVRLRGVASPSLAAWVGCIGAVLSVRRRRSPDTGRRARLRVVQVRFAPWSGDGHETYWVSEDELEGVG